MAPPDQNEEDEKQNANAFRLIFQSAMVFVLTCFPFVSNVIMLGNFNGDNTSTPLSVTLSWGVSFDVILSGVEGLFFVAIVT